MYRLTGTLGLSPAVLIARRQQGEVEEGRGDIFLCPSFLDPAVEQPSQPHNIASSFHLSCYRVLMLMMLGRLSFRPYLWEMRLTGQRYATERLPLAQKAAAFLRKP